MADSASRSPISFGTDGWRAVMAREFTFDNVALVAQAIADFLRDKGIAERGIVVGWDARFLSEHFGALVADVMSANGIPVFLPERDTPTPVVAYNVRHRNAAGAVMLTASHNPPEYNGIKFIPDYCHPALPAETDAIMANVRRLEAGKSVLRSKRHDSLVELIDPKPPYVQHLKNLLDLKSIGEAKLEFWYDPLYATGRGYLDEILREAGAEVHVIHGERNPLFGNSLPDPNAANLSELSRLVVETQASLGLSTDGDADRFGIVDKSGAWLSPNQILVLVFLHWLRTRYPKGSVVRTAPTTHQVDALAKHFGFEVIETPVGFKWVGNALNTTDAIVGGEESGGLSVKGHIPEKDGILADLIVVEQMATTGKTPLETLREVDEMVGHYETDRVDVHLDDDRKSALMQQLRSQPPVSLGGQKVVRSSDLDGVQLILESGAWTLIRPSGTEPLVRCYLEAHDAAEIEKLKAAVQNSGRQRARVTAIRAIFFDIGDTLLFDEPPLKERVRLAIEAVRLPYDKEELPGAFRVAEDYAIGRYLEGVPADDPGVKQECAIIILRELGLTNLEVDKLAALRHAYLSIAYQRGLHPDAIALVEELHRRGFIVGAISDWEETLPSLLAELELAKHLDALAVSAIVGVTKPDPRLFEEALKQAGVSPSESLHIGDYYELDVAGACAAGMTPVLFDWKDRTSDAACIRVKSFEELKTYLLSLPAP